MLDFEVYGTAVPYVWLTDPDGDFGYEIVFLFSGQVFTRVWQVDGADRNISPEDMMGPAGLKSQHQEKG